MRQLRDDFLGNDTVFHKLNRSVFAGRAELDVEDFVQEAWLRMVITAHNRGEPLANAGTIEELFESVRGLEGAFMVYAEYARKDMGRDGNTYNTQLDKDVPDHDLQAMLAVQKIAKLRESLDGDGQSMLDWFIEMWVEHDEGRILTVAERKQLSRARTKLELPLSMKKIR